MSSSTEAIQNFNKEQLVPILTDIHTGVNMMNDIIEVLSSYRDTLYEIMADLKDANYVTDELKAKIDKNVSLVMNEVQSIVNKCVAMNNVGKYRGTLLDRMKRGYTYKYKTLNGNVAENPNAYIFDIVRIDTENRIINVGDVTVQVSNTDDYEPGFESGSVFETAEELEGDSKLDADEMLAQFITGIEVEVEKVLVLQSYLDVVESNLKYFQEVIETDIRHFCLFDADCLDELIE